MSEPRLIGPDFEAATFTHLGRTHGVFRGGAGPGVVVIHELAVEPSVLAPVLSQPGLPAGLTAGRRAALGLDAGDLAAVRERTRQGLCVLGLRFSHDRGCPADRFEALRTALGEAFEAIEVDSSPGNPFGIAARAHSVLTIDLIDEPGHPTHAALERVLAFLGERLRPAALRDEE